MNTAPRARRRTSLKMKCVLACFSACSTIALIEGGLRLTAALRGGRAPAELGPKLRADGSQVLRVLCLGDSNTYGLYEQQADSWPAQVERLLSAATPAGFHFQLVNEGFPGQNSSDLRVRAPAAIERTDADLLVLWVGKNNTWSTRNMEPYLSGTSAAAGPPFLRDLYLYRLFKTFEGRHVSERSIDLNDVSRGGSVSSKDAFEIALQYGSGDSDVALELALEALEGDLKAIAAMAAARELPMLVLSYPLDLDRLAALNIKLEVLAKDAAWTWVDTRPWIAAALRRARYEELFHHDFHLRAKGYRVLAPLLATAIAQALQKPEAAAKPELSDLDQLLGTPARHLSYERRGSGFVVHAHGPPHHACLLLGGRHAPRGEGTRLPPYHLLPILLDAVLATGTLDAQGEAQFELGAEWSAGELVLATQAPPFAADGVQNFDVQSFALSDALNLATR